MIGEMIRAYRTVMRMTVRELAWKLGVSPATISRLEKGKPCDQATMMKLLNWLFPSAERAP